MADHADKSVLIEAAKKNEQEYLDKFNSPNWKVVGTYDENVKVWRMDYGGRGVATFRGETVFQTSVENMDKLFGSITIRGRWDEGIDHFEKIAQLEPKYSIVYLRVKPVLGGLISSRDFTDVRVDQLTKTDEIYEAYSCQTTVKLNNGYKVPNGGSAVRGQSYSSGMYMKGIRTDDGKDWRTDRCTGNIILQTDPKGWIIQSAVNQAMTGEITRLFARAKKVVAGDLDSLMAQVDDK